METNTFQIKGGVGRLPTPRSYTPTPRPNDNYTCRHVYLVHWQVARMYSLNFARTLRYNRIRIPFFFCFLFLFFSTVIFRLTSFSQRKIIASTSRWICMNVDERIEKALREHFLFFPFWVQIFLIFPSFFFVLFCTYERVQQPPVVQDIVSNKAVLPKRNFQGLQKKIFLFDEGTVSLHDSIYRSYSSHWPREIERRVSMCTVSLPHDRKY